jgi:hypothetical protein
MHDAAPVHGAARALSHPAHCQPWCTDCDHHDLGPPGVVLHRSAPAIVALYDEACELVDAYVRAAFWDKTPDWIGTDPADIERPHVEVCVPSVDGIPLYLNPGQARAFAAALVRAAAAADTEAFYRPPVTPGAPSATVTGTVPSGQA